MDSDTVSEMPLPQLVCAYALLVGIPGLFVGIAVAMWRKR